MRITMGDAEIREAVVEKAAVLLGQPTDHVRVVRFIRKKGGGVEAEVEVGTAASMPSTITEPQPPL